MSSAAVSAGKKGRAKPLRLPNRERSLATSLLFVLPLLVAYQIGILASDFRNGADFITRFLFEAVSYSRTKYLILNFVVIALMIALYSRTKKRSPADLKQLPRMLIESLIYALVMGSLILFVMSRVLQMRAGGVTESGLFDRLIMSIGAGVHEELVFRLGLFWLFAWALNRLFDLGPALSLIGSIAVSSVLFSLAHHVGSLGEPFHFNVFVYRLLAGAIFALIFYYRSFATAVYTHALYDIYVMIVRNG